MNKDNGEKKPLPHIESQKILLEQVLQATEPYANYHVQMVKAMMPSVENMATMSDIISANNSSIALFKKSLGVEAWQLEIPKIHKSWVDQFAPIHSKIEELKRAITIDLSSISKNLTLSESIVQALNVKGAWVSIGKLSPIFEQLRANEADLSDSIRNIMDSILVPTDCFSFPYLSVEGASREIFTSTYAIGTLYPSFQQDVPFDLKEEEQSTRNELNGCEELIRLVDPELVRLYLGSLEGLNSSSPDKTRHVLISLRELCMHILHKLAPTKDVMMWIGPNDKNILVDGKITRNARVLYICRNIGHDDLKKFVELDAKIIVQLFEIFNDVHKINSQLTDNQLSALVLRTESFVSYIINISRETNPLS